MDILSKISTSKLFDKVSNYIESHNLIPPESTVIIGLSGGPDSVFLLIYLYSIKSKYNLNLIAAHLDHGWREESDKDLIFCERLCKKLDLKFISQKADNIKITKKPQSKEDLGRLLRRKFFENLALENNANIIALAHHADDQIETFFIRLIRGAGVSGLAGIKAQNGIYTRPLLNITKQEILDYLDSNNIKYLQDPTNLSDDFLRNKIRNNLIKVLKDIDSRSSNNILKAIDNLQTTDSFLEKLTETSLLNIAENNINKNLESNLISQEHNLKKIFIDIKKFFLLDEFIQDRVILLWLCKEKVNFNISTKLINEIKRFLMQNKSKSHQIYKEWQIIKNKNLVSIEKNI